MNLLPPPLLPPNLQNILLTFLPITCAEIPPVSKFHMVIVVLTTSCHDYSLHSPSSGTPLTGSSVNDKRKVNSHETSGKTVQAQSFTMQVNPGIFSQINSEALKAYIRAGHHKEITLTFYEIILNFRSILHTEYVFHISCIKNAA